MTTVNDFLSQMKAKCEARSKEMAALELSIHDDPTHKKELKQYFGFTDKKLAVRKKQLQRVTA